MNGFLPTFLTINEPVLVTMAGACPGAFGMEYPPSNTIVVVARRETEWERRLRKIRDESARIVVEFERACRREALRRIHRADVAEILVADASSSRTAPPRVERPFPALLVRSRGRAPRAAR